MADEKITRHCKSCGQTKPLSAFIQMNINGLVQYGQICATCRKTMAEDAARQRKVETEGENSSGTGHKIDTKARMSGEKDKRDLRETVDENYHADREKDKVDLKKTQMKQAEHLKTEKKHHAGFLEKRRVLSEKPVANNAQENKAGELQHNTQEENKKTQFNYQAPFVDPQVAGQLRFQGESFQRYRQWLGKGSALAKSAETAVKKAGQEKGQAPKTPEEFVEKNWGPKKR